MYTLKKTEMAIPTPAPYNPPPSILKLVKEKVI